MKHECHESIIPEDFRDYEDKVTGSVAFSLNWVPLWVYCRRNLTGNLWWTAHEVIHLAWSPLFWVFQSWRRQATIILASAGFENMVTYCDSQDRLRFIIFFWKYNETLVHNLPTLSIIAEMYHKKRRFQYSQRAKVRRPILSPYFLEIIFFKLAVTLNGHCSSDTDHILDPPILLLHLYSSKAI